MTLRLSALALLAVLGLSTHGADWARFRGPAGSGVARDSAALPSTWSPTANLAWKTPLPGPGASSPIIVGGKAFVTSYSGYGLSRENPGQIENLVRHLTCVDMNSGEKLWQRDIKASLPEDPYSGIGVTAHGYASHTPVSDGKHVYAFFGKSGVHAFDLDGQPLWQTDVGKESDPTKWGSSSSPILYENTVVVTASAESQAIVGLDKNSGEELWRQEAKGLDGMWGTPALVEVSENRTDLVMCVAKELWGLDPNSGKLRWFAEATGAEQAYASLILDGKRLYAFTGRGGGGIALDAGGSGNVSHDNTVWQSKVTASFGSPVQHESKLYVVARGVVTVVDAASGERVQQLRLRGVRQSGGTGSDYPSPIIVGRRLFCLSGSGRMFVLEIGDELKQIAVNEVTTDRESFWGTPAVSNASMLLRSGKFLYCVANKGEAVRPADNLLAKSEPAAPPTESSGRRGRGFDPMSMFKGMDSNKDGKVTHQELEGHRMADRLKTLDKDGDNAISQEEFRTGIATLFRRGGRRGGDYGRTKDNRPDRPQRPEPAEA